MTTSSMTMGSMSHFSRQKPVRRETYEEAMTKMKQNLVRYSRADDKGMILRSLKDVKFLSCLHMEKIQLSDSPITELEKEVLEETKISINSSIFYNAGSHGRESMGGKPFLSAMKRLCQALCFGKRIGATPTELYQHLVNRLAPSTGSADPYFRLNSLLGSEDLLVMPLSADNLPKINDKKSLTNIDMTLYESGGDIHLTLNETFKFGLFRKIDVKNNRPWITLNAVVRERQNVTSGASSRYMSVDLPTRNMYGY